MHEEPALLELCVLAHVRAEERLAPPRRAGHNLENGAASRIALEHVELVGIVLADVVECELAIEVHALDEAREARVDVVRHGHALEVHEVRRALVLRGERDASVHREVPRRKFFAAHEALPLPRIVAGGCVDCFQFSGILSFLDFKNLLAAIHRAFDALDDDVHF